MEDIINEELLEDGTKKISIYSGHDHKLKKYYHVNDKGQKHGEEVETSGDLKITTLWKNGEMIGKPIKHGIEVTLKDDIETTTQWENGEIVGKPIKYNVRGGDKLRMVDHLSELEDNQTHTVLLSDDFHELKGTPLEKVLASAGYPKFICGVSTEIVRPISITIKDNQIQRVRIDGVSHPETRRALYKTPRTYYMEFKDGKEYNGSFVYETLFEGTQTLCQYTEGKCSLFNGIEPRINLDLSEELKNSPQSVSMSDEARASLAVIKALQQEGVTKWKRSHDITPDNVETLPAIVTLPRDGSVSYDIGKSKYIFTIKDGKLDGEFSGIRNDSLYKKAYYKDSKLNGPYQEFFENSSQVKISGSYKDDKKNGVWKYYDHEGKVIKTELWKDGVDETAKYAIMRKVSAKHAEHREPVTKIGKAIQKTVKAIEVRQELKKLQQYRNG